MNPYFLIQPPLSNDVTNRLYAKHVSNKSSPRELAVEFNVSIARVKAIIKLKRLEKEQDGPLQTAYSEAMDRILCARGRTRNEAEAVVDVPVTIGKPRLVVLDSEDAEFTQRDAAELLQRKLPDTTTRPKATHAKNVLDKDTQHTNRFDFVFTDVNKKIPFQVSLYCCVVMDVGTQGAGTRKGRHTRPVGTCLPINYRIVCNNTAAAIAALDIPSIPNTVDN
jgi:hypothetical protein